MVEERDVRLKVTAKQLSILQEALDLYVRVGIGQLEIVAENISFNIEKEKIRKNINEIRDIFDQAKKEIFGFACGESFGISSSAVDDATKIAYDMQKVVQKEISEQREFKGFDVWRDGPILHLGSEPIATVEKVEKD
jgi:hypothetical protein